MKRFLLCSFFCLLFSGCNRSEKKTLHLFVWSEYFSQELIELFESKYDCHVSVDTYDSNEALFAKLRIHAGNYDVVMPSNYIYRSMIAQKLLDPLDRDQLPNLRHYDFAEVSRLGLEDISFGLPYILGYTCLGYHPKLATNFVESWTVFSDTELAGRMTMLNDPREVIGAALKTLGYSVNSTHQREIDEAVALVLTWKPNLAKFEGEQYKNGLASREFIISQGYSSDLIQVIQENPDVACGWPLEGAFMSVDYLSIPKGSENQELAHRFIDFVIDPEIAQMNLLYSAATPLVKIDRKKIPFDQRLIQILYPPPEVKNRAELIEGIGDAAKLYIDAWERILME